MLGESENNVENMCKRGRMTRTRAGKTLMSFYTLQLPSDSMKTILVVEDDPLIREPLSWALEKEGYTVVEAVNGVEAICSFDAHKPDLVVLDILMPDKDGLAVCTELRERDSGPYVPIIFISSLDQLEDKVRGFNTGGDQYLAKPFHNEELLEVVKAGLRQVDNIKKSLISELSDNVEILQWNNIQFNTETGEVFYCDHEVDPPPSEKELEILRIMLGNPNKIFHRDEMMDRIVDRRTIDSHVANIRSKFVKYGPDPIETVHGRGYRLVKAK